MKIEIASPWDKMSESGSSLLNLIQNNNTPNLDLLVRESLQNCLDAGDKHYSCVNVDFFIGEAKTEKICAHFDGIKDSMLKKFGKQCHFIAIKDSNTVGLNGPVRKRDIEDGRFGNYLKLVTEISKAQDQPGAGGLWGLGKTVYFRIGVGLVVYYSRIKKDDGSYESRLSAAMVEDETKPDSIIPHERGKLSRGIAWWGQTDRKDKTGQTTVPVTNENTINTFLRSFGLEPYDNKKTGTLILIPFVDKDKLLADTMPFGQQDTSQVPFWCVNGLEDYLRISIQRWYAPRIQNKSYSGQYLNVSINVEKNGTYIGTKITFNRMSPVFQLIQRLYNSTPNNPLTFNDKEIISKPIEIRSVFKKGSAIAGYINYLKVNASDLKMTPPDNLPSPYKYISKDCSDEMYNNPIVLFTRKPGMIVSYATTGDWTYGIPPTDVGEYLVAIFVVNSDNELLQKDMTIEEYLRHSEKADHMTWSDWVIDVGNPQILTRIQKGIQRKIKEDFHKTTEETEEKKNIGLGRALGEMVLPPEGLLNWNATQGGGGDKGGAAGDRTKKKTSVSRSMKTSIKPMGNPKYGTGEIAMPIRLIFGNKRRVSIELAVNTEGKPIDCDTWDDTFPMEFPIELNSFVVTSATKGKGKEQCCLISKETTIDSDQKTESIVFSFKNSKRSGAKVKLTIDAIDSVGTVIDGILKYKLTDVQGTIVFTEEA